MTTTQTTTQIATQEGSATAITPQHPLTEVELEELLNIAMGEQGGGTRGLPPDPQEEEDRPEEEDQPSEEEQRHNQSQQQ